MKNKTSLFYFISFLFLSQFSYSQNSDSVMIRMIYSEALSNGKAYEWLSYLSNKIGGRLSGSPEAQLAVEWTQKTMETLKPDNVFLQECMVPKWVRGSKEKAGITSRLSATPLNVPVCALGGSIGTGSEGLTGNVIEIKQFEQLEEMGIEKLKGKIIFFNRPMNPTHINTFEAYGGAAGQRYSGAMKAAPYGAIGVIVRSMTLAKDDFPHTGAMGYNDTIKKIPACAISTNGADLLSDMLKKDPGLFFSLKMDCKTFPDEKSYNVIAELKGSEFPDEIITVGGHLDAWDTGDGAHDDGAGVVQSMEIINLFKVLGIKPKRTIRIVAFMNEENGSRGGKKYAEVALLKKEKHLLALESDAGGSTPHGFGMNGPVAKTNKIRSWQKLFFPYGLFQWDGDGDGADIGHLRDDNKDEQIVLMGLSPDSQRYFDYHHSANDVFANINRRELELGAASMAALIYLVDKYGLN